MASDYQRWLAGRAVITVGCLYEIVALWVDDPRCPPISEIIYLASNHRWARFAAWTFGGFALDHLFGD